MLVSFGATDSDVALWLQPSPLRYSNEWKRRKSRKAENERPVIKSVEQAEEEILVISQIKQDAEELQDAISKAEPPASKSKPKPQKVKLPLALRRLRVHNEALMR